MTTLTFNRKTKESDIALLLNCDGTGQSDIDTGIGFFDHMLKTLCFYAKFDLTIKAKGDLTVDTHHTVEDVGIVLGQAFLKATTEHTCVKRFGMSIVPMDEALVRSVVDLGGRSFLKLNCPKLTERIGKFETETLETFFDALTRNGWLTLHIDVLDGKNSHHIVEAIFKSLGQSLFLAMQSVSKGDQSLKGNPIWKGSTP